MKDKTNSSSTKCRKADNQFKKEKPSFGMYKRINLGDKKNGK